MSIKSTHPLYGKMKPLWVLCRDVFKGENHIKAQRAIYLKPTSGMVQDGFGTDNLSGEREYTSYLYRAYCPEIYEEAVLNAVGVMHRKTAEIQLPAQMESMRTSATPAGESLQMLLRKINAEQLTTGRLGIMGDLRTNSDGTAKPVVVVYDELAVRNWDDLDDTGDSSESRFVVLDESTNVENGDFEWEWKERYRVLALTSNNTIIKTGEKGTYATKVLDSDQDITAGDWKEPSNQGGTLDSIPFVFINTADISSAPSVPPLKGLANLVLAIYRGEADYRQNLFLQAQDTLVRIGGIVDDNEVVRVGAGARIDVPANGDAKYIGVSGKGLPEQGKSLAKDYERATQKAGQLLNQQVGAEESAEALRVRIAARSASLPDVARAGAMALEKLLKQIAIWLNANPDEVVVKPNLEFANPDQNGQTLVEIMQAKVQGAPLSNESIHEWMRDNKFTNLTYEAEIALIDQEKPRVEDERDI